ncbi:uncharacterized protein LOC131250590 [Magnolia sinica]|uniref:uncharacterized protein LOC131250590 n=1 Tax=Magnolia sinica TaxID=86752 RepID=UPI002659320A|nr:uncharacterized protein LOC131250590 [Magnolia sinica]
MGSLMVKFVVRACSGNGMSLPLTFLVLDVEGKSTLVNEGNIRVSVIPIIRKWGSREGAQQHPYGGISLEDSDKICNILESNAFLKRSKINTENCSKLMVNHTDSSKPFVRLRNEIESTVDEGAVEDGANDGSVVEEEEKTTSLVMESLQAFKEALANGDKSMVAEIESFLLSIEVEKKSLDSKVAALSQELSSERDRVISISADFDNFRKRIERERLSLVTNVQGEVVESLLPVLDNFKRAKAQIKVETEGEEKINNSYQSNMYIEIEQQTT